MSRSTYFNIPITLGYSANLKSWRLDAFVSARYNMLMTSKMTSISSEQTIISDVGSLTFFEDNYFDWTVGTNLFYHIGSKYSVLAGIEYRPPVRNKYQDIVNTYQYFNANLGLAFHF